METLLVLQLARKGKELGKVDLESFKRNRPPEGAHHFRSFIGQQFMDRPHLPAKEAGKCSLYALWAKQELLY